MLSLSDIENYINKNPQFKRAIMLVVYDYLLEPSYATKQRFIDAFVAFDIVTTLSNYNFLRYNLAEELASGMYIL